MITFDRVTLTYNDAARPALRDVNLTIPEGDLCLVVGQTGAGKSTLLGAINGIVPHFTGGVLEGTVSIDGRSTRDDPPRELADVVGAVVQDPLAGFVTDTVEEELAYGMEQLAVPADVMRKRVEETLDLLGLADLRRRPLHELSGGQQQRVAIGAALTPHPRVLVLDEPTSALDPVGAEEVLSALTRLVHDLGITIVLAEHRLERVVQHADRVVYVNDDGAVTVGSPADVLRTTKVAPPIVELGRLAGWDPLPLSVRDARRAAGELRDRLPPPPARARTAPSAPLLRARDVVVRYGDLIAVRSVDLDLKRGEVSALMGRNGSGKSSLLWALHGAGPRQGGTVTIDIDIDTDTDTDAPGAAPIGLVPQTPTDLLYQRTVRAELGQADRGAAATEGPSARAILDRLVPGIPDEAHPRDLSEGQRLALVLTIQLRAAPRVVLLDEPTRGLDYAGKAALATIVRTLADEGRAVALATHDVEFAAHVADRVVVMAEGELVASGPAHEVLVASPAFSPQVAKILAPLAYLTVDEVSDALTRSAAS